MHLLLQMAGAGRLQVEGSQAVNLRDHARGKECTVRLPGICNGNPETTVLAHYRVSGISGIGKKPPDLIGAWACSDCHRYVDTHKEAALDFAIAVFRTQAALLRLGKVRC